MCPTQNGKKQTNKQTNKKRICQNSKINCLIKKIPANLHVGFSEFWSKEKAALYNKSSCPFGHFLYLDAANSKKVIVPVVATVGPLTLMIVLWFVWRHLRRQNRNNDDGQNLIDEQYTQPIWVAKHIVFMLLGTRIAVHGSEISKLMNNNCKINIVKRRNWHLTRIFVIGVFLIKYYHKPFRKNNTVDHFLFLLAVLF